MRQRVNSHIVKLEALKRFLGHITHQLKEKAVEKKGQYRRIGKIALGKLSGGTWKWRAMERKVMRYVQVCNARCAL